jgi:hypothetical protein
MCPIQLKGTVDASWPAHTWTADSVEFSSFQLNFLGLLCPYSKVRSESVLTYYSLLSGLYTVHTMWRSSLILFIYEVRVLLYGAKKTGNLLTV